MTLDGPLFGPHPPRKARHLLPQVGEGPVAEVVADPGDHHADHVLLVHVVGVLLEQVARELSGDVSHACGEINSMFAQLHIGMDQCDD